ncbi:MAG: substrate-binding domain-containing protein [Tepidisphaeraceae bacterium]
MSASVTRRTRHLTKLGCKNLAFLHTHPEWPLIRMRGQAFLNGCYDGGQQATVYIMSDNPRAAEPYGPRVVVARTREELAEKFAKASPQHDGVFIANDEVTARLYPMFAEHGIRLGQDVQVISCDNEEARLAGIHPRPATIDIGAEEIGYRAVNRLLNRIERPNGPPLIIQVTPRIVPAR